MSLGSENRKHIVHLVYNLNSLILLAVSYAEAICTVHNTDFKEHSKRHYTITEGQLACQCALNRWGEG